MDGWNTSFLFGYPIFRGYASFREGKFTDLCKGETKTSKGSLSTTSWTENWTWTPSFPEWFHVIPVMSINLATSTSIDPVIFFQTPQFWWPQLIPPFKSFILPLELVTTTAPGGIWTSSERSCAPPKLAEPAPWKSTFIPCHGQRYQRLRDDVTGRAFWSFCLFAVCNLD